MDADLTEPLAQALRRAAKNGDLNYMSLSTSDGIKYNATYRGVGDRDVRHVSSPCPAAALYAALTGKAVAKATSPVPVAKIKKQRAAPVAKPVADASLDDLI